MKRKKSNQTIKNPIVRNGVWIAAVLAALILLSAAALHIGTRHGSHRTVPDFTGMHRTEAERLARNNGLRIEVNDSLFVAAYDGGAVLDQLPKGGVEVKAGRTVYITVNSSRQKSVKVPYVAHRSLRQAKNMLEAAGLGIERLEYVEDIATNYVLAQYLGDEEITSEDDLRVEAEMGSGVILRVGVQDGYGTAYVPKLVGLTLARAKSRLWEMGYNVGKVSYDASVDRLERANARVWHQSVGQGRSAALGASVDLKLTTDAAKVAECEAASDAEMRRITEERAEMQRLADSLRAAGINPDEEFETLNESKEEYDDEFFD